MFSFFIVTTIENGEETFEYSFFLLVFHAKSGITNKHQTGLSDISYYIPANCDSNKNRVEKNRMKFSIFCLLSKGVKNLS